MVGFANEFLVPVIDLVYLLSAEGPCVLLAVRYADNAQGTCNCATRSLKQTHAGTTNATCPGSCMADACE
jgi:hypothetical protein